MVLFLMQVYFQRNHRCVPSQPRPQRQRIDNTDPFHWNQCICSINSVLLAVLNLCQFPLFLRQNIIMVLKVRASWAPYKTLTKKKKQMDVWRRLGTCGLCQNGSRIFDWMWKNSLLVKNQAKSQTLDKCCQTYLQSPSKLLGHFCIFSSPQCWCTQNRNKQHREGKGKHGKARLR